jgi:DNA-binding HxlR family transcriptional regulator
MLPTSISASTHKRNLQYIWETIGAKITGTGLVRISADGGQTYPKYTETTAPTQLPTAPTASRIYAQNPTTGEWETRCIVFDLDAKKHHTTQDVTHDAHKLTTALTHAGIKTIQDISPTGGRHIYIPLNKPIPGPTAINLLDRIKAHLNLTTCDITPMRGYKSGLIRTPAAPHKTGGHQTLTTPHTQATHTLTHPNPTTLITTYLNTLPPTPKPPTHPTPKPETTPHPNPTQKLNHNWKTYAQTGKHTHLKNAQGKPYPSPSEARLGFLAYLHRTGHTHQTTLKNITNGTWPALTHTYNKYQPTQRQNLINHEWTLATTNPNGTPRTHTPKPPKNPIHYLLRQTTPTWATKPQNSRKKDHQTAIRQWWTLTETHGTTLYGGTQTALTTRLTLKALAARAHQHGNTTFPCSHRTLRLYTGLSLGTIQKTIKHLLNQKNPLIQLTHQGKLNTPNTYRLTIPNTHQKLAQTPYKKGPITPLPKAFYTLNKAAWFIYNTYTTPKTKHTHQELTKKTGISARRITATLKTLVTEGFLEETTKAGKKAWKIYKWCDLEELAWWTDGLVAYNELNDEITKQQKQWKKKCLDYHLSMKYVYTKFKKGINSLRGIDTGIYLCTNMNSKVQRTRRGVLERRVPTPCSVGTNPNPRLLSPATPTSTWGTIPATSLAKSVPGVSSGSPSSSSFTCSFRLLLSEGRWTSKLRLLRTFSAREPPTTPATYLALGSLGTATMLLREGKP